MKREEGKEEEGGGGGVRGWGINVNSCTPPPNLPVILFSKRVVHLPHLHTNYTRGASLIPPVVVNQERNMAETFFCWEQPPQSAPLLPLHLISLNQEMT